VIETRKIIQAINQELLIDELLLARNQSLILMFNFIYSEFTAPEWLVKTSLIDVDHNIRALKPYQVYQQDNQTFVLDYIQEVKPYHVQIREFNLAYNGQDTYGGNLTDFDVPAYWDQLLQTPQYVSPVLTPYTQSGSAIQNIISDEGPEAEIWTREPWIQWYNNYLLSIISVNIVDGGAGYTDVPTVTVTGDCITPAVMTAVVNSAGRVVGIVINDPGEGYLTTAIITITSGNGVGARAVAVMGNTLVRAITTTIKYDRYEYTSNIVFWEPNVIYTEGTQVRYDNRVWQANSTVSSAQFLTSDWSIVEANTLSGVNRTQGFYTPTANEPGLELPLLIDGIDYPGVQVQGPEFNQNTGFDVGNFDINPWDNISISPEGFPTYDPAILDAIYSSNYLDIYLGTRPTDINVDGGAYVDTYSSHAPEELVPGAIFDTLDFRVYTTPGSDYEGDGHGFATVGRKFIYDPYNPYMSFAGMLDYPFTVFMFNATLGVAIEPYYYDWANYQIVGTPYAYPGNELEILVTGVGGGNQLYLDTYLGTDLLEGNEVIVPFPYSAIYEFLIYNGEVMLSPDADYTWAPQYIDYGVQTVYEPNGSSGTLLYVGSTVGIVPGSKVDGIGFTSGQVVTGINGPTSVTLSAAPDSTPSGLLKFLTNTGKTIVTFSGLYTQNDRINLAAFGYASSGQTHSWSLPVFQQWIADGTLSVPLTNSMQGTNPANIIIQRNGVRARPAEGEKYIGDGSTTTYDLPWSGDYSQDLVANNDVTVYVNDVPLNQPVDYVVDPEDGSTLRTITFTDAPAAGDQILISVRTAAQYFINGGELVFRPSQGLSPQLGDIIEIVSWNDTFEQDLLTQVWVGPQTQGVQVSEGYDIVDYDSGDITGGPGSYDYAVGAVVQINKFDTGTVITNPERVLVTLNGRWLSYGEGYSVDTDNSTIIIAGPPISPIDVVVATTMTQSVVPGSMAFRIFQDMRGAQATYRITPSTTTYLTKPVVQSDTIIYVDDASKLSEPEIVKNIWGVVTIDGERIMYRERDLVNNTISSLLRGTAGTAVDQHAVESNVYDMGRGNIMPLEFQNYVVSNSFLSNGSTTAFVADNIDVGSMDSTTLEEAIEVYVGGIRQTSGYVITADNPVAVLFAEAPTQGVDITVLVRRGVDWYQPGEDTPSNGVPLQNTDTAAARFLRGK
jgi:hypothetical protein